MDDTVLAANELGEGLGRRHARSVRDDRHGEDRGGLNCGKPRMAAQVDAGVGRDTCRLWTVSRVPRGNLSKVGRQIGSTGVRATSAPNAGRLQPGRRTLTTMIRFLVRAAIFLASSAIGLLVAKVTLDGMTIDATSFVAVVVIFAVLQSVLAPFFAKVTARNAPALLGATGLISTFVALLVAELVSDGFTITGIDTWVLATLIVWITTMLATLLLPIILVKFGVENARDRRSS